MINLSALLECENFTVLTPKLTNPTNSCKLATQTGSKLAPAGFETFPTMQIELYHWIMVLFSSRKEKKLG
jgi:hypothetical protein